MIILRPFGEVTQMGVSVHSSLAGGVVNRDILPGISQELAFSTEEYQQRLDGVRRAMRDAVLTSL